MFVSNPNAPLEDPRMKIKSFIRDSAQNEMIGLSTKNKTENIIKPLGSFNESAVTDITDEIVQFNNPCPNCQAICETNMKVTGNYYFCLLFGYKICGNDYVVILI